jgi:hypothetical protein
MLLQVLLTIHITVIYDAMSDVFVYLIQHYIVYYEPYKAM